MATDTQTGASVAARVGRAAIILFLGGAAAYPYVRGPATVRAPTPASSTATGARAPSSQSTDPQTDALTLLGEFVNLDVSETALLESLTRAARPAAVAAVPCVALADIRTALTELRARANPPGRDTVVDELISTLRTWYGTSCKGTGAKASTPEQDKDDLAAFVASNTLQLRIRRLKDAFARQGIADPQFVVVTVPDPIDSNARWTFDGIAAALQSAAGAMGFVLDRFYLPDWDPLRETGDRAAASRRVHEQWPGVVIFRDAKFGVPSGTTQTKQLLVMSLVSETPTAGVHRRALRSALDIAWNWTGSSAPLRVLGPVFSGSAASLAMSLKDFRERNGGTSIHVVTGSATSENNKPLLESMSGEPRPTFGSTVLPDELVQCQTIQFLIDSDAGLIDGEPIALLVEGNTTYGQGLGAESQNRPASMCSDEARTVLDRARKFPFPLHISRLRSAADGQGRDAARGNQSGFLSLSLGEPETVTDQIPSMTPGSTSSSVELVLANILETISREHITTIGLLATDTRDKLFLAERVARWNDRARLFTIESDLFYAHPDYSPYLRGMIVASSYPLFNRTQAGSGAGAEASQLQFGTTNAEGIYNALIALFPETSARPLDYSDPDRGGDTPPVWISVVGANSIWPLRWYSFSSLPYLYKPGVVEKRQSALRVQASRRFTLSAFVLSLFVAAHVLGYALRNRRWMAPLQSESVFLGVFAGAGFRRRLPYLLVAFVSLALYYGYYTYLFASIALHGDGRASVIAPPMVLLTLALGGCAGYIGCQCLDGLRDRIRHSSRVAVVDPQYWIIAIAAACSAAAILLGGVYLWQVADPASIMTVLYFERAAHPWNGVSPLMPLTFIVAAVYLWAGVHAWRLRVAPGRALLDGLRPTWGLGIHGVVPASQDLQVFLDRPVQSLPRGLTLAVLCGIVIAGYVALFHPLATPEPAAFTWSFRAAWLLMQILLLITFALVIHFWALLRRALEPFDGTPMAAAFDRLPPHLMQDRLSPRHPHPADLRRLSRFANQLGLALREMRKWPREKRLRAEDVGLDENELKATFRLLCGRQPRTAGHRAAWTDLAEWRWLLRVLRRIVPIIRHDWEQRARQSVLASPDFDGDVKTITSPLQQWILRAEDFVAMQVLLLIRELLARLANVFFFVIVGVLLMVAVAQSFPFQPRQELLGTAWIYVMSAVTLVITIVFQMERNPVLSAIASTDAGRVQWDFTLWSKLFVYGIVPLATVFAAQFPQIGTSIVEWLRPMQGTLP